MLDKLLIAAETQFYTFGSASQNLIPLVFLALFVDGAIVAIWYMAGVVINSDRVKASARGEFYQIGGTVLIVVLALGSLLAFGLLFVSVVSINASQGFGCTSAISGSTPLTQACMSAMCAGLIGANGGPSTFQPIAMLLDGALPPGICNIINTQNVGTLGPSTATMDYPLAASAVVVANLTNQTVSNLNYTFMQDAYFGFLRNLELTATVCIQWPGVPSCYPPVPGSPNPLVSVEFTDTPMSGLLMIIYGMGTFATLLYTAMFSFVTQLLFADTFLYLWPYLLFAGIALRGIFFTRKIGGLFIAAAVGGVIFYPTLFAAEYLTSTAWTQGTLLPGGSPLPPTTTYAGQYRYTLNYFVEPNVQGIAGSYGCYPGQSLVGAEGWDFLIVGIGAIPFWGSTIASAVYGLIIGIGTAIFAGGGFGAISSGFMSGLSSGTMISADGFANTLHAFGGVACTFGSPNSGAEGLLFALIQSYGIIGVTAYFLPILNVLMTLTGIVGLSGLFGGEVNIVGLSRFI